MSAADPATWDEMVLRREWLKMAYEVGSAWDATPDDMVVEHDTLADVITALVAQRDEAKADTRGRVDERNATAIATVAHREGYNDALADVRDAMVDIPDGVDAEWRLAFLSGWLTARKPVLT